jgi:hypothetical protein
MLFADFRLHLRKFRISNLRINRKKIRIVDLQTCTQKNFPDFHMHAHQRYLRICNFGTSPKFCGFAICGLKNKMCASLQNTQLQFDDVEEMYIVQYTTVHTLKLSTIDPC